jgi:spoIIIJ-associated protein
MVSEPKTITEVLDIATAKTEELFKHLGLPLEIMSDPERRRLSVMVDGREIRENIASVLPALDHLVNLMVRKDTKELLIVDLNHYRKERERLIVDLAKAAAHRAMVTKEDVELPPMNAYERRLVHVEIQSNPELRTESVGLGKARRTFIRRINES